MEEEFMTAQIPQAKINAPYSVRVTVRAAQAAAAHVHVHVMVRQGSDGAPQVGVACGVREALSGPLHVCAADLSEGRQ